MSKNIMSKDKFNEFVDKLQKEIIDKEIERTNERIVELFYNPKNWGQPPDDEISISHECIGQKGEFMKFFLKIEDGIVTKANFLTDGCGVMVATGCQTTLLIKDKALDYIEKLKPEDIEKALNGLPEDEKECAQLSVKTLKSLIEKYKYNPNGRY